MNTQAPTTPSTTTADEEFDRALTELRGFEAYVDEVLAYRADVFPTKREQVLGESKIYAREIIRSISENIESAAASFVEMLAERDDQLRVLDRKAQRLETRSNLMRKEQKFKQPLLYKGEYHPVVQHNPVECMRAVEFGREVLDIDFQATTVPVEPVFTFHQLTCRLNSSDPESGQEEQQENSSNMDPRDLEYGSESEEYISDNDGPSSLSDQEMKDEDSYHLADDDALEQVESRADFNDDDEDLGV